MQILLPIVLVSLLCIIIWQDFSVRAVSWFIFPGLILCTIVYSLRAQTWAEWLISVCINLLFLLLQYIAITLYFSLKHKRLVNICDKFIGSGDLLFFLCAALFFSPGWFILYFLACLFIAILAALPLHFANTEKQRLIPLAGIMASVQVLCVMYALFTSFRFYSDNLLIHYLFT